jgi:HD-GYP domain-containing protein (c-di-GMP phosphodiesterase class II)
LDFLAASRPDGSGYPRGVTGDEIPIEARILRVADVFSALMDARSYKPPMGRIDALERMRDMGAGKLDVEIVHDLEAIVSECDEPSRRLPHPSANSGFHTVVGHSAREACGCGPAAIPS